MQRILIIEDEEVMRQGLIDLLRSSGYDATALDLSSLVGTSANTSSQGHTSLSILIDQILAVQPDLILLDINLPGVNGELLLKSLRNKSDLPVIMVTSSSMEMDEVLSMSYGADDYVVKPYNPQVLLLRIAAVLKRVEGNTGPIKFHNLSIDLARGVIEVSLAPETAQAEKTATIVKAAPATTAKTTQSAKPKRVLLTKNEMIILGHLLSHQGEIVTRDALMTDLWNNHEYINDNALTVNISRVRAKLKSFGLGDAIETRKGLGYVLS